jgi:hypothetical protein
MNSTYEQRFDVGTGHVNNVMYNRYAESARVNWTLNFANTIDPANKTEWKELMTPKSIGLILRSIRTDYKFVRGCQSERAVFLLTNIAANLARSCDSAT